MDVDCAAGGNAHLRRHEPAVQTLDLISLHVPKAFGTSLGKVLAEHYGPQCMLRDYGVSLESGGARRLVKPNLQPGTLVVHGHFPAARYADMPARRRVTFLRDPVRRTVSHFFFWQTEPRHGNAVHDQLLDGRLGLLEFARLPAIRRFYADTVFGGCDMRSFDLVGIVEDLARDWPRFQRLTGIQAQLPHLNRNSYPGYAEIIGHVMSDAALLRELRGILAEDIEFYARYL
ncbi:MAG: sulfotransferase family 2 domain-containing protein [Rhodospirillaceae bacterium]|nr:sulfotransferase family 2 domain-containing protein [Rhodospirillaceae bacterium]